MKLYYYRNHINEICKSRCGLLRKQSKAASSHIILHGFSQAVRKGWSCNNDDRGLIQCPHTDWSCVMFSQLCASNDEVST